MAAGLILLGLAAPLFAQAPGPQPATVGDLIALHYGVPNAIVAHKTVTVGTSAVELTVDDASRFADVYSNLGTSLCEISHSNAVSTTNGFPLASDGVISENWRDDMTLPTLQAWAVCGAAGQTIDVLELKLP